VIGEEFATLSGLQELKRNTMTKDKGIVNSASVIQQMQNNRAKWQ